MLIITLINAQQQKPLQQWRFDNESSIRIGRSPDNQVIIQADQISRFHIEIQQIQPQQWLLINHGTNGTFFNGNRVQQLTLFDEMEVQLAQGGPILKFQLQNLAPTPPPTIVQTQHVETFHETSLHQENVAQSELEVILSGINAQFPPAAFAQRQQEITARLREIQSLQASLQPEITRLQTIQQQNQSQGGLLLTLSVIKDDLENQRQSLERFQQQMQKVREFLDQLEKHFSANKKISQQIQGGTRVDTLVDNIRKQLHELDQELGRIHEQHLLENAKQSFAF